MRSEKAEAEVAQLKDVLRQEQSAAIEQVAAAEARAEKAEAERDRLKEEKSASIKRQNDTLERTERELYLQLNAAESRISELQTSLAILQESLRVVYAHRDQCVEVLRSVEWVGRESYCPVCFGGKLEECDRSKTGHSFACRLAAALASPAPQSYAKDN